MERMQQPGVRERLWQLAYLLKHTFAVVGRHPGIVRPWGYMAVYATVMVSVFFAAIAAIAMDHGGTGTLLLVLAVVLFFYKFFFYNRLEIQQSWLVAEAVQGRSPESTEARAHARSCRHGYRRLALLDMVFGFVASRRNSNSEKSGLISGLVTAMLAGLTEVWDLVNHYLLPAIAVDGVGVREGISQMRDLRDRVPESLVGVFGIDLAARAAGTLVAPLYLLAAVVAVLWGLWIGDGMSAFYAGSLRAALGDFGAGWLPDGPLHFNWLPALVAIWLCKGFSAMFERLVTSVKVVYFTVFYMRITHPGDLDPAVRDELEAYLRLEGNGDSAQPATEPR
ncbi:hypothetical protein KBTX_00390 [wastewater metagenome]|uniref:Uncharacterized protein n=5 Tax=root TaxID=1 RepID=A0A5B8RBM9_9ZZZZ|nr:hypothetical protein KBTEX_00390 [uncultured organism]